MGDPLTQRLACQDNSYMFFAQDAASNKLAAQACTHCPIFLECRLEGLEGREFGVWGGLSHNQRIRMGNDARVSEIRRLRYLLAQKRKDAS